MNVFDFSQQKLIATHQTSPTPFQVPIQFSKDGTVFAMGSPEYAVSFYNFDVVTSSANDYSVADQKLNSDEFNLFTYPTKRTSLLDFHFSRKNTVVAVGTFET